MYFNGIKLKIVTHCNSRKKAMDQKNINPRIEMWVLELQSFDHKFKHSLRTPMQHVDALRRTFNVLIVKDNPLE